MSEPNRIDVICQAMTPKPLTPSPVPSTPAQSPKWRDDAFPKTLKIERPV